MSEMLDYNFIIYEDEFSLVYYIPGTLDRLFVSFSWRDFNWHSPEFFMRRPLQKLGFSVLGIVAKGNNWFPRQSVEQIALKLQKLINGYADITVCGSSMGAYAAIKYVRNFNANRCLAFSPLWSVIEKECVEHNVPFRDRWKKDLADSKSHGGYKVASDDISFSADYFLFSDFFNRTDRKHLRKIKSTTSHQINLINVPFSGHPCIRAFKGTDMVKSILTNAFNKDTVSLRRVSVKAISYANKDRSHRSYEFYTKRYNNVVARLSFRHPKLSYRYIKHSVVPIDEKILFLIAIRLAKKKAIEEVLELIRGSYGDVCKKAFFNVLLTESKPIIDHQGNFVCYDLVRQKITAEPRVSDVSVLVKCFHDDEHAILSVPTIEGLNLLLPNADLKILNMKNVENISDTLFSSELKGGGRFFSCDKGCLSVDRKKRVTLQPRKIKAYELFLIGS